MFFSTTSRSSRRKSSVRSAQRRLLFETLEELMPMACDLPQLDTNFDGMVTAFDALHVINALNLRGIHRHNPFQDNGVWVDVDFSSHVTAFDAILIINDLNLNGIHDFIVSCPNEFDVVEREMPAFETAVRNADIVLSSGDITPDSDQDLLSSKMTFVASQGSALNVTEPTLWVDLTGDDRVDAPIGRGSVVGDTIVVDASYVFTRLWPVYYELHATVASSLQSDPRLQVNLLSMKGEVYGTGEPVSSEVTNTNQTLFTFVAQGSLRITKSFIPVEPQYVVAGMRSDGPVARYFFEALYEDIEVTDLASFVPGNMNAIRQVEIVVDGFTVSRGTISGAGSEPVPSGGFTYWSNTENGQNVIREGATAEVLLYDRILGYDEGGVSGVSVSHSLVTRDDFVSVQARGRTSSNVLRKNNGNGVDEGEVFINADDLGPNQDIFGVDHIVTYNKPASFENVDPQPDGSIPMGDNPLHQVRTEFVGLVWGGQYEQFSYIVNATNVTLETDRFAFYNKEDATTQHDDVIVTTMEGVLITTPTVTGLFRVIPVDLVFGPVDVRQDMWELSTYVLQGNVLSYHDEALLQVTLDLERSSFSDTNLPQSPTRNIFPVSRVPATVPGRVYRS